MSEYITIKRALISVYDKTGVVELAQFLVANGVDILSTGKTHAVLSDAGIKSMEVSEYTGCAEIMGGRVKTLHPKIHGGILGVRGKHDFGYAKPIDLVVSNLYPFSEAAQQKNASENEIIEQIDIGGVALIRAAAKNFRYVGVITNINDYQSFVEVNLSIEYRRMMAERAFELTCQYDMAIHQWFSSRDSTLPDALLVNKKRSKIFRYGENPHQKAGFYSNDVNAFPEQVQGKELSYNNIIDAESAVNLVLEFVEPTVVIVKHTNPCGVASDENLLSAYKKALGCDPVSSFGGIVAVNREVDAELASCIIKVFTEVVIAPSITPEAKLIFAQKKNLRVLLTALTRSYDFSVRNAFGGLLLQDEDQELMRIKKVVTKKAPASNELEDLEFAWRVCKHVKSNAIVIAKNKCAIGIGAGQMSRIDSMKIAIDKSQYNLQKAVLASDAFFPFDDCVKLASTVGMTALIQPGGSIRDQEVIDAADNNNLSMVFTDMRHFKH